MSVNRHGRARLYLCLLAITSTLAVGLLSMQLDVRPSVADERPLPKPDLVVAPGLVEPVSEQIALSNLLQGTIRHVLVKEGDRVVAGQILAELENDDLTASVAAATAELALRHSERAKLINGARPEERRVAAANLRNADAIAAMAALTFQRRATLAATHVTSLEAVDQARTDLRSATARRDALAEQVELINAPPRQEDVAIADANIALADARLRTARALLEKSYVHAPIDGTILRILRHTGEQVSDTFPSVILMMGDTSTLRIRTEVDETDIGRVKIGERAYATADAYGEQQFAGVVTKVAQCMGKKAVHTDDPSEKIDAKVLDVLVTLQPGIDLPVGLRMDVFIVPDAPQAPAL
jgi:HlyD family secretion protein